MKRQTLVAVLVGLMLTSVMLAPANAQEPARRSSLSERLGSLSFGWLRSSDDKNDQQASPSESRTTTPSTKTAPQTGAKQPARQAPSARVANVPSPVGSRRSVPTRVASLPESRGRSLPRVNPRDVLPRDFPSPSAQRRSSASSPTKSETRAAVAQNLTNRRGAPASDQGFGSLRSKILQDLRELREEIGPATSEGAADRGAASRTAPRVGSVLSQGGSQGNAGQLRERIETAPSSRDFLRQSTTSEAKQRLAAKLRADRERVAGARADQARIDQARALARKQTLERQALSKSIAAEVAEQMASNQQPAAGLPTEETAMPASSAAEPEVTENTPQAGPAIDTPIVPIPQAASGVAAASPPEDLGEAVEQPATAETEPLAEPATKTKPLAIAAALIEEPTVPAVVVQSDTPAAADNSAANFSTEPTKTTAIGPATAPSTKRIAIGHRPTPAPPVAALPVISLANSHHDQGADDTHDSVSKTSKDDDILITKSTPQIAAKVFGPRRVIIGQSARFQVHLKNRGSVDAESLATRVRVPEWAEVANLSTSTGVVQRPTSADQPLSWRMDRFAAGAGATMDLTLVAREGRPIELGVDWTHAPVSSHAFIEVQEPKLQMRISGADEVYYGKPQLFRLTLSNPGSGVAEGVTLKLAPPGKSIDEATQHTLGDLQPGASKSVEIELTAREAGRLALAAQAYAAGGVTADVNKEVFCRKPEIKIDWRGPEQKYTGAPATYYFRVRNAGTAPAEGVDFDVTLPEGFEMTSASEGQSYDSRRRLLRWRVGNLRPGDDHYMELKGVARTAGQKRLNAHAETADKLIRDDLTAVTNVVAVADLKLDVQDPKGPLPVGADVVYEVRVTNRGSNVAEMVEVIALFSGGIEPLSVEGKSCRIADGRVTAPVIERLPAGAESVLRIHAKAIDAGTHIFRAEVACRDLEIRLAAEEMTRFYPDDTLLEGDSPRAAGAASRFSQPR